MGTVAEKIRIAMIKRKLSLKDLAVRMGTTPQNLSNKLKRDNFSEDEIRKIAAAMNAFVKISFILHDSGEEL